MGSYQPVIKYKLYPEGAGYRPTQGYSNDAGWDIYAWGETLIPYGGFRDVATGLYIEMPDDLWAFLVGRSSMPRKHGIRIESAIIDPGYRGEIFVGAHNIGGSPCLISNGQRIAQLVFLPRVSVEWQWAESLNPTSRGEKGIGSTG